MGQACLEGVLGIVKGQLLEGGHSPGPHCLCFCRGRVVLLSDWVNSLDAVLHQHACMQPLQQR